MSITVRDILELNEKLLNVQVDGGGFQEISTVLGELLGCQVVITDSRWTCICCYPKEIRNLEGWFTFDTETDSFVCTKFEGVLPEEKEEIVIRSSEDEEVWGTGIWVKSQCIGCLYIIGSPGQFDGTSEIVCRQTAGHLAIEFTKSSVKDQDSDYKSNNFFMDLISDNVASEEEAVRRARGLYWPQFPLRMVVSDIDDFETVVRDKTEEEIQLVKDSVREVQKDILKKEGCFFIGNKSDSFHCLFSKQVDLEMLRKAMERVRSHLQKSLGISVTVGISRPIGSFSEFKRAYRETRTAVKIGKKKGKQRVCFIEEERMEEAFYEMAKMNIFQKYVSDSLEILEEYDQKHGSYLVETVKVLTENLGARKETADALYLHRNTLTHRIRRIEQLIDADLDDPEVLFGLYLAVKIRTYMK